MHAYFGIAISSFSLARFRRGRERIARSAPPSSSPWPTWPGAKNPSSGGAANESRSTPFFYYRTTASAALRAAWQVYPNGGEQHVRTVNGSPPSCCCRARGTSGISGAPCRQPARKSAADPASVPSDAPSCVSGAAGRSRACWSAEEHAGEWRRAGMASDGLAPSLCMPFTVCIVMSCQVVICGPGLVLAHATARDVDGGSELCFVQ